MELLLIVLPCIVVGTGIGLMLDRAGVLPRLDGTLPAASRPATHSMFRPLSLGAIVILATWILAWLVILGIGLNIILGSA